MANKVLWDVFHEDSPKSRCSTIKPHNRSMVTLQAALIDYGNSLILNKRFFYGHKNIISQLLERGFQNNFYRTFYPVLDNTFKITNQQLRTAQKITI